MIDLVKRHELRLITVCMVLLGAAAIWLVLTRPAYRIEGDFLQREDQRKVDAWLRDRVRDAVGDNRARACLALGRIADESTLYLLIQATKDPSPQVRAMAAFAIGEMEDAEMLAAQGREPQARAAEALLALFNDTERGVIAYAVEALGKMHWRPALKRMTNTPAPYPITVSAMARMRAVDAAPWIAQLVKSDDQDVRWAAVEALNRMEISPGKELTQKLVKLATDRNARVRAAAAQSLARAEPSGEVVEALLAMTEDRDPKVRIHSFRSLGRLGRADLLENLVKGLGDRHINVRIAAAHAIGDLGSSRAVPLLQSLRFKRDPLSYAAEEAIAKLARNNEEFFQAVQGLPPAYESPAGKESFFRALRTLGSERSARLLKTLSPIQESHHKQSPNQTKPPKTRHEREDYQRIARTLNRRLSVQTSAGGFELVVHYDEAPLTAEHFVTLAEQGAFDGQRFVAVEPGRFVEFQAAKGDEGEDWPESVRCEINTEFFVRGSLGMFADPKDSGGYRFFICLNKLPEFDGRYTNLGRLVSGDDLIDEITRETKIYRVGAP